MVQTRSQVRKHGQPPLPMHVSLSSDDSSSPNSSRHHHLSKHQAPAQPHPLGAAAAPQQRTQVQPQQHPQPPRSTTGAALSVTHSSQSSHRDRYSNSVSSQKRPSPSPGSPTNQSVPRNTPSLSVHSSRPEQIDKTMKASKSLRLNHWRTLNDVVALI
ncbi:hypothetical protein V6N13_057064 [Hibiscus sabdariffa]